MNVIINTKRYKYTTVFVYHFYRYIYMHLQQTDLAEETLEGNHAFEMMSD